MGNVMGLGNGWMAEGGQWFARKIHSRGPWRGCGDVLRVFLSKTDASKGRLCSNPYSPIGGAEVRVWEKNAGYSGRAGPLFWCTVSVARLGLQETAVVRALATLRWDRQWYAWDCPAPMVDNNVCAANGRLAEVVGWIMVDVHSEVRRVVRGEGGPERDPLYVDRARAVRAGALLDACLSRPDPNIPAEFFGVWANRMGYYWAWVQAAAADVVRTGQWSNRDPDARRRAMNTIAQTLLVSEPGAGFEDEEEAFAASESSMSSGYMSRADSPS